LIKKSRYFSAHKKKKTGHASLAKLHRYNVTVKWTGNTGSGTSNDRSFERSNEITAEGKETMIPASSDVLLIASLPLLSQTLISASLRDVGHCGIGLR
jgi:hypothetical protein